MHITLDILMGIGLALAAGIRPFLPALLAGALASANALIDFGGTDLSFLESSLWLLAVVVALIIVVLLQRRGETSLVESIVSGLGIGIGAVLFAGALADSTDTWWPGLLAGVMFAAIAERATRALF